MVRVVMGETMILRSPMPSSSIGFIVLNPAFWMPFSSKASSSRMMVAVGLAHLALAIRAAGFIATSTSQKSPGVLISIEPMCTWKPDTPETVP